MATLRTLTLPQLADEAPKWDDLWQASVSGLPSKRSDGVRLWCESFAPDKEFYGIVVEEGQRFVAALPLVKERVAGAATIYRLAANCMATAGDLLIDPSCDGEAVMQMLASHVATLNGTVAAFEGIDLQVDRWQQFISALNSLGRQTHTSDGYDVGEIDILHDWDAYTKSWSRNHRSAIKRSKKKLDAEGKVEVVRLREPSDNELYETLEACFIVEDMGWKGDEGTSILKTPELRNYVHQDARMIRDLGMLDLWLLKLDDQIIAFEYCHYSKGTCFSHKISFDPAFDRFSPGRVLRCMQLERYHEDPSAVSLNTLGMLCSAKAKWTTRSYCSSRLFVAIGNPLSNLLFHSFKKTRDIVKKFRKPAEVTKVLTPGAIRYLETADPSKPSLPKSPLALPVDVSPSGANIQSPTPPL